MIYNCTTQGLGRKCTAVGAGGTFANSSCGGGCTMPAPPARQWPPSPPPPAGAARPNILFILSDDLGFNDVSLHGSPQIPTPHIDGLARAGLTLLNYHANPSCSPTRASILTGRHMIHHGIFGPFRIGFAGALDTAFTLLPQYLQRLGMQTHAVGKWHLGFGQRSQLPRARGFDSYLGYWNGAEAYSNHTVGIETTNGQPSPVYDFIDETGARPTTQSAYAAAGQYSTHVFTARAVDIIKTAAAAPTRVPWFVYLAYQSVHWPLEAPASTVAKFAKIPDKNRQLVAAMASEMDTGVGEIVASLKATGAYNSTLIIFTSDNGGPTNGFEGTQSNNYPLRESSLLLVASSFLLWCHRTDLTDMRSLCFTCRRWEEDNVGGRVEGRRPRQRLRDHPGTTERRRAGELRARLLRRLAPHPRRARHRSCWGGGGPRRIA
jgi:hypothetical protein